MEMETLCSMGAQLTFRKSAAKEMGMYVIMNSGKVKA